MQLVVSWWGFYGCLRSQARNVYLLTSERHNSRTRQKIHTFNNFTTLSLILSKNCIRSIVTTAASTFVHITSSNIPSLTSCNCLILLVQLRPRTTRWPAQLVGQSPWTELHFKAIGLSLSSRPSSSFSTLSPN